MVAQTECSGLNKGKQAVSLSPRWSSWPAQPEAVSLTGLGSGMVCAPADLPYDPAKGFSWVVPPASSLTMGELLPLLLAWAQTL